MAVGIILSLTLPTIEEGEVPFTFDNSIQGDTLIKLTGDLPVVRPMRTGQVSRGDSPRRKIMTGFEVTWYNDKGTTTSGKEATAGVTCAVDPAVIPLGTTVKITLPNGESYTRIAEDTGGEVIGKIIDIHSNESTSVLNDRGRTMNVEVEIIDK